MKNLIKNVVTSTLSHLGYKISKTYPVDYEKNFIEFHNKIKNETMTSLERQHSLFKAVEYVIASEIEGDIVECGVWRGGSAMLAALTLKKHGMNDKDIYLYDTFAGMSRPTEHDVTTAGKASDEKWKSLQQGEINAWDYASQNVVEKNIHSTGYPMEKVFFVKGKVEETIPNIIPEKIALLRLDTDWYESTAHELEHLFPKLSRGGVLIIDDYGHWQGARKAVDEYIDKNKIKIFLNRIDYTGRLGIKT